ncbi:GGDEF domain-containing protein [Sulfurimonas sp. MAG313]|nr:GGDEF domain-containing protein [Sulfurimonas sp. MAG313]MDF1881595.1 GGDEF domain-containing protein [Sulfurimonas sp. MAG313]
MAGNLRKRRDISALTSDTEVPSFDSGPGSASSLNEPTSDLEMYSKEVLSRLIHDNLPPTPSNFTLYFDRLLEDKSETLRKQINSVLEFEDNNDDEKTIELEKSLKQGFTSIKSVLQVTANVYKNTALMEKILVKRRADLGNNPNNVAVLSTISSLDQDIGKLNNILKKQVDHMKTLYQDTASIVKNVENETIYDNQFGIYNKRYLLNKLEQEKNLIEEFKHTSSLITIELSKEIDDSISNQKALLLMTRTIARLLMKTSRRSDVVAHYGDGVFVMILKHTDTANAKRASERLCELVSSSNFFLAEKEIQLKISIGIANISAERSVEETLVCGLSAMEQAYQNDTQDYCICTKDEETK